MVLAVLCILGVITFSCFYALKTKDIEINYVPLSINNATLNMTGFSTRVEQLTVSPNNLTIPNTKYKFIASVGSLSLSFHTSWNQTQLDIKQPMTVNAVITNAEYTYISGQKYVNLTKFYSIEHSHDILWLLLAALLFAGIIYSLIEISKGKNTFIQASDSTQRNSQQFLTYDDTTYGRNKNEPTLQEKTLNYVKQFKPSWINEDGKWVLEGGETHNNANLVAHLRNHNLEVKYNNYLPNKRESIDVVANQAIAFECKPTLTTTTTFRDLVGEIHRDRRLTRYEVFALIYGDARADLYNELCEQIGKESVIVLGNVID
jgi:hypothetical protein